MKKSQCLLFLLISVFANATAQPVVKVYTDWKMEKPTEDSVFCSSDFVTLVAEGDSISWIYPDTAGFMVFVNEPNQLQLKSPIADNIKEGVYTVYATQTKNGAVSDSAVCTFRIASPPPEPGITGENGSVYLCGAEMKKELSFRCDNADGYHLAWLYNNDTLGFSSEIMLDTNKFSQYGDVLTAVLHTGSCMSENSVSVYYERQPAPDIYIATPEDITVCSGEDFQIEALSVTSSPYHTIIKGAEITNIYGTTFVDSTVFTESLYAIGVNEVKYFLKAGLCSDTVSHSFNVEKCVQNNATAQPVIKVYTDLKMEKPTEDSVFCSSDFVTLVAEGDSIRWIYPDTAGFMVFVNEPNQLQLKSPVADNIKEGFYTVYATQTKNGAVSDSAIYSFRIDPVPPAPSITGENGSVYLCGAEMKKELSFRCDNADGYHLAWLYNNDTLGFSSEIMLDTNKFSQYGDVLTAVLHTGSCMSENSVSVYYERQPAPDIYIATPEDITVCSGEDFQIEALSVTSSPYHTIIKGAQITNINGTTFVDSTVFKESLYAIGQNEVTYFLEAGLCSAAVSHSFNVEDCGLNKTGIASNTTWYLSYNSSDDVLEICNGSNSFPYVLVYNQQGQLIVKEQQQFIDVSDLPLGCYYAVIVQNGVRLDFMNFVKD